MTGVAHLGGSAADPPIRGVLADASTSTVFADALGVFGDMPHERALFGTVDPDIVGRSIDDFCVDVLGSEVRACRFVSGNQSSVWGLDLADGRQVVVKATTRDDPAELGAICDVQRQLHRLGFPCPEVVVGPAALSWGTAVVHELVERGDVGDTHNGDGRAARAATLAWLHGLLSTWPTPVALTERTTWRERRTHPIWPRSYNPVFDLEKPEPDAAWIDALALRALYELEFDQAPKVLGHQDWSAQNLRVEDDEVVMVFDWDSLFLASEAATVGTAAVSFPSTWPGVASWASPDEAAAFISEYEDATERRFGIDERRILRAAAVYSMAYTARCEFAHHGANTPDIGSYRHALSVWATDYFEL